MILLDTDVLLDVALDRQPHVEASAALLSLLECRSRMAFVAWHTLSNFYYLVSPTRGRDDARQFLIDRSPVPARTPKQLLAELT